MKKRIFGICLFFIVIVFILAISFCLYEHNVHSDSARNNEIVNINEIEQLIKLGQTEEAINKLDGVSTFLRNTDSDANYTPIILISSISVLFVLTVFLYIYFSILRPFDKLKGFAKEISSGNFDIPLEYERSNYFGKFTWSFDMMRNEIKKARRCEKEAIENNKTVIASLSHDIKTPIASIKAYSEALEANMDNSYEERMTYINVIMRKADEVKKLTDDLFVHSISDMDRISFNYENVNLDDVIINSSNDFKANTPINYINNVKNAFIYADRDRLYQIFENIINNSIKYANTKIDINLDETKDNYIVTIKDYGRGIDDSDMPFIFEKFYRGKNSKEKQGTGLGLYIVKYMIEKMNGIVELENDNGLKVKLIFKKILN
ncbi:MAG: HAMP domain-containing histidine kinase [Acholeplasmatales bacterium]|nr:HAMP domain-containing histidine kinase [Acholeplasmatales bacterium]